MILKWYPMSKNLQIYIGLLHLLLVIVNSAAPPTTNIGSNFRGKCPGNDRGGCIADSKKQCEDDLGGEHKGACNGGEGRCCIVGCSNNEDCPINTDSVCIDAICVDACPGEDDGFCVASAEECTIRGGENKGPCLGGVGACCLVLACGSNDDCREDLDCQDSMCIDPCLEPGICPDDEECRVVNHRPECIPRDCVGENEVCSTREDCAVQGVPTDTTCFEGFGVCCKRSRCDNDADCTDDDDLACIGGICTDPCEVPGVCGCDATCVVFRREPVCECPDGFIGEPSEACFPGLCDPDSDGVPEGECVPSEICESEGGISIGSCAAGLLTCCAGCESGDQCSEGLECRESRCSDPCDNPDACGTDAICTVVGREAVCTCPPGYIEVPEVGCRKCTGDADCPPGLACVEELCINPCDMSPCGLDAECTVNGRASTCNCREGFTGDPFSACYPTRCDPEDPDSDGSNGACLNCEECANQGGVSKGTCAAGFGVCCSVQECDSNEVCPLNLACIDSTCQDPCPADCGDQTCIVVDHIPKCQEIVKECKFEDDCPSKLACRCREGGEFDCIDLPCNCDENCPDNLACIDSSCSDPCDNPEACGVQATCTVVEHEAVCDCPPDFTGDPDQVCFPTSCDSSSSGSDVICFTSEEECSNQGGIPTGTCASGFGVCCLRKPCDSNTDCPSNLACINSYCSNPCGNLKTCGFHAICAVYNHHPYCFCPDHYTGNASDICFPTRCKSKCGLPGDCLSREACSKQHGISDGSCASGLGVCCVDSKYCDHPGYINKLSCRPTPKYTPPPPSPPSPPSPPPPPSYPSLPSPPSPPEVVYRKKNPVKKTLKRRP